MKIFRGVRTLPQSFAQTAVALGNFDGLHLGHQELIKTALAAANHMGSAGVVYTFDPNPVEVLHPEKGQKPLFSRQDLAEQLAARGVDALILEPFTRGFARVSAEDFVRGHLVEKLQPRHVVVGQGFVFGHERRGTAELLREMGRTHGFEVHGLEPVRTHGEVISSSRIRRAVAEGRVDLAATLLGRAFYVEALVVKGDGRGRTIGVPTANMRPPGVTLPHLGVYATRAIWGGKKFAAVTNVGRAPTFHADDAPIKLETHILDQDLDLSGSSLRVEFISYLREEKRFAGREELVAQIRRDIESARQLLT